MRAMSRLQRLNFLSPKCMIVRKCSSSKRTTESLLDSYIEEWEPKLLGIKRLTNADADNIDTEIDEINDGLKQ